MSYAQHRSTRGFTLIELLVVISIIALLIAVLLPALKQARASAQSIQCASQFRQLGIATHIYLNDSGGILPPGALSTDADPQKEYAHGSWASRLAPYLGRGALRPNYPYLIRHEVLRAMRCPLDPRPVTGTWGNSYNDVSYGINWYPFGSGGFGGPANKYKFKGVPIQVVEQPSNMLFLTDGRFTGVSLVYNYQWTEFRHLQAANVLYVDGHVEAEDPQALEADRITSSQYNRYQTPWCYTLEFR